MDLLFYDLKLKRAPVVNGPCELANKATVDVRSQGPTTGVMRKVCMTKPCRYIESTVLYQEYLREQNHFLGFLESLQDIFFLIIDDFGKKIFNPGYEDFVHMLLANRKSTKKPTFIFTNLNGHDFMDTAGLPIFSRVTCGITIRLEGKDRRKQNF